MKRKLKDLAGGAGAVALVAVMLAAVIALVAVGAREVERDVTNSCVEHCAGRNLVVASHTIYGCECRRAP